MNKLSIVLITYNRAPFLEKTLHALLNENSPVCQCPLTILNNCSTDRTREIADRFVATHPNVTLETNNFNVGGNANIAKALERCSTPYHWILCDDDVYDWSNWKEVEAAMERGEKVLCVGDRHLPSDSSARGDPAILLQQMTFLPSIIYGPGVITSTALRNAYDNTYALFPHLAPVIMHLNAGGSIWVATCGVVEPGDYGTDISYTRGDRKDEVFIRSRTMVLSAGFACLTANINDRKLSKRTFAALIHSSQMGLLGFLGEVFMRLRGFEGAENFHSIWKQATFGMKLILIPLRLIQNSFLYPLISSRAIYDTARRIVDRLNRNARMKKHG